MKKTTARASASSIQAITVESALFMSDSGSTGSGLAVPAAGASERVDFPRAAASAMGTLLRARGLAVRFF